MNTPDHELILTARLGHTFTPSILSKRSPDGQRARSRSAGPPPLDKNPPLSGCTSRTCWLITYGTAGDWRKKRE